MIENLMKRSKNLFVETFNFKGLEKFEPKF